MIIIFFVGHKEKWRRVRVLLRVYVVLGRRIRVYDMILSMDCCRVRVRCESETGVNVYKA